MAAKARSMMDDGLRWVKTHCGRMDHGGCGLRVGIRDKRIVEIQGDPDGYLNQGYICPKGRLSAQKLSAPARLRRPLKRRGKRGAGKWDAISWDQALTIICKRFLKLKKQFGAKAVAFCQGMPKGLEHFALIRLANSFGSPNVVTVQDVCHAPREVAGFHTCGFYPVADHHWASQLLLLWGSNPTSTNEEGIICSQLRHQFRQGAKLIVVDPRKTVMAAKADVWLQVKPGTDFHLAMAFLQTIFAEKRGDLPFVENWTIGSDELAAQVSAYTPEKVAPIVGVPARKIRQAARLYAAARPAAIGWGNAIEQHPNAFQTARALVCLMAICGNLDVPGGNICAAEPPVAKLGSFVRADRIPTKKTEMIHAHFGAVRGMMTVPPAHFKKAVLEQTPYPVKGAYMQCTNPLVTWADSRQTHAALMALEFIVVSDIAMTPTAAMADLVLPAATHFEFNDVGHYGLGHGILLARPKLVDPPEGCWPDIKILNELGKTLTQSEDWYDDHEALLDEILAPSRLTYAEFCRIGYLKGTQQFQKYLVDGFKTPTGKVALSLSRPDHSQSAGTPTHYPLCQNSKVFPLLLTSAKNRYHLHSSYRWLAPLRRKMPRPLVWLHPATAKRHGIRNDDAVMIATATGHIVQWARITDSVREDVVCASYGWWYPEDKLTPQYDWQRSNYNMLTAVDPIGQELGTPALKGIPCRIRRK